MTLALIPNDLAWLGAVVAAVPLGFTLGYRVARRGSRWEQGMDRTLDTPPAPLRAGGDQP